MRISRQTTLTILTIFTILLTGCASNGVTALADGFKSYDSVAVVREHLKQAGVAGRWQEEKQSTSPSDRRPSYQFFSMSGPYHLLGLDGVLKLIFYNDRLMGAEFSTLHGSETLAALRRGNVKVPKNARDEVTIDRRTRLRYDVDANGVFHFSWRDEKLAKEWSNWIRDNS